MAHQRSPPDSQRTPLLEADGDSDMDSGVGDEAGEDAESPVPADEDRVSEQDRAEEHDGEGGEFIVFVAFKGNMEDEDFAKKLEAVVSGIPNVLDMGSLSCTLVLHEVLMTPLEFTFH